MSQPRWFDSHCHLDLQEFDAQRVAVWARARAAGVMGLLVPGLEPDQWARACALVQTLGAPSCWSAGLHPWWLERVQRNTTLDNFLNQLRAAAQQNDCSAIGECGVDGAIDVPMAVQIPWLEAQLALACELDKPVILHQVKAHNALVQLLKRYRNLRGVVHGFSGSMAMAKEYLQCGMVLGIGGVVSYPRAAKTRAVVAALPQDGFVLETDAPSMPIAGWQGRANEPANLLRIAEVVAQLRGQSLEQLATAMAANTQRLWGITF